MMKKFSTSKTTYSTKLRWMWRSRGFSVLESIVAITLISAAISGTFAVVRSNLSQSIVIKNEVQAFYLAHEVIEILRNKRDSNQLNKILNASNNSWLTNITNVCPVGNVCRVSATNMTINNCNSTNWGAGICATPLNQNSTTYLYAYTTGAGWTVSPFRREFKITSVNANEISVEIRVHWAKNGITRTFTTKANLLDWI